MNSKFYNRGSKYIDAALLNWDKRKSKLIRHWCRIDDTVLKHGTEMKQRLNVLIRIIEDRISEACNFLHAMREKQQADDRERGQQLILMHCSKFVCHYSNKAIGMAIEYSKYDPEKVYSCPVCGSPYVLDVERDIDDLLLDLGISTDKN